MHIMTDRFTTGSDDGPCCRVRFECLVSASPQAVFDFHEDPHNLSVVMPPTTRVVEMLAASAAREGDIMVLSMKEFGIIPMKWECRWRTVQAPHLLVDEMIQGPFKHFVHRHAFEDAGKGMTRIIDEVHYSFGTGLLGRLVSTTGVRLYLHLMFAWRRRETVRWFAHKQTQSPVPSM